MYDITSHLKREDHRPMGQWLQCWNMVLYNEATAQSWMSTPNSTK